MNLPRSSPTKPRVLAVSSGGGHWVQLLRLRPAFEGCEVTFATVDRKYRADLEPNTRFIAVPDSNMWQKWRFVLTALGVLGALVRVRPHIVVSTGAAPGFFAIRLGALFGIRTIWIDSIANAEKLSLSGREAGKHASLWLTQWAHLADSNGPRYFGNVL